MNVLGLDTSTAACAACVLRTDGQAFEVEPAPGALAGPPAHARELLPAAVRCLDDAGIDWGDLDAIAVGVGPGGFTGLRIGIATARALASSSGVELRSVSSLAALAAGIDGDRTLALIDARRGELFGALYEGGEERWEPFAAAPEAVAERILAAGGGVRAAGDGAVRFRDVLEAAGVEVDPDGSRTHVVRGLSVCRLAATAPAQLPGGVLPDYQRLPDAKPLTR